MDWKTLGLSSDVTGLCEVQAGVSILLAPQIPLFVTLPCLMGGGGAAETINRIRLLSDFVLGSLLVLGLKGCLN